MADPGYTENKDRLLKRLNRAEGQIRGISRMVAEDTYCIDVLTQISAVQAAIDKVALELLRDHARHCLATDDGAAAADPGPAAITSSGADSVGQLNAITVNHQKADELVDAISRLLSR